MEDCHHPEQNSFRFRNPFVPIYLLVYLVQSEPHFSHTIPNIVSHERSRQLETNQRLMARFIALTLTIFLWNVSGKSQIPEQVESRQKVFQLLTRQEPLLAETVDHILVNSDWETIAYWDKTHAEGVEFMQEAVPDKYYFQGTNLRIDFIDPENLNQIKTQVQMKFRRETNRIKLYTDDLSIIEFIDIYFIDENYMVMEFDGLRVFLIRIHE